jgi:hypothetical protein
MSRLLEKVSDEVFFRGIRPTGKHPQTSDPADYALGTDHPLRAYHRRSAAADPNIALVAGGGAWGQAIVAASVADVHSRFALVRDPQLTSAGEASDRAAAVLREGVIAAESDEAELSPNVGQELLDVVTVTEPRAGLGGEKRRVTAIRLDFDPERGLFRQWLTLGGT